MKRVLFLWFSVILSTASADAQNSKLWTGSYTGDIDGVVSTLSVHRHGLTVTGSVDAQGYRYTFSCQVNGDKCKGMVNDPQTGANMAMLMAGADSNISVRVEFTDDFGNAQSANFDFRRVSEDNSGGPGSTQRTEVAGRDERLIGNWLFSDTYISGDFSMTTQYRLVVNPDGTYLYGDAKLAGGGNAGSVSSDGGDITRGKWKTEHEIIYVNDGSGWQPYCTYYLENNSLMLTFDNGKRQVWSRQ